MTYPGKIPDPALEEWFADAASQAGNVNPVVRLHGPGPLGKKCKECALLSRHLGKYFKCGLRAFTRGPGSDHRANWLACGKFEAAHK